MREEPDGVVRAARAREVDEPDAVRELVLERARRLDREPALADAGRAGQRHEAVLVQQSAATWPSSSSRPTNDVEGAGQIAAAPAVDRDGGDRRVVREDRLLEPPKLRPRLEPQLVGEHAPRLLERLERVRLAAAAVERQHQLPPQPLAERVVRERRAKRRRELAMLAERERDLELLLERVDVQRLEPARLGAEPRRAGQALQRRSAPERRAPTPPRPPRPATSPSRSARARLREQLLEPDRVDARAAAARTRRPSRRSTSSPSAARRRAM